VFLKNFYIFFGVTFLVFIGALIIPNQTQAQVVTGCSQLAPATCQNPATSYICYPQWCGGAVIDINGATSSTDIWCRHRPCQWTGVCVETPEGDESDALLKPCENQAIADCSLGWESAGISQGWCIIVIADDECVGKKWCDLYQEKQYRKYYCEASGGIGDCGFAAPDPPGTIKVGEDTCDCLHAECEPECNMPEDCSYEGAECIDCVCVGGTPPECPICPLELQGGFVPCGRSCDDPITPDKNECNPCQLCDLFVMLDRIIDFVLFTLVPIIAVLMIVIGGIMYMVAHFGGAEMLPGGAKGGPAMLSQAKKLMTSVVYGLVIIYGAWLIINTFLTIIGVAEWTGLGEWFEFPCP